ncbi:histidine kinase N-terminal 7TM domain-containing protein, partial [Sphaerochaeta sp.]|uniref:histidine kinase N-terminal 7TM domain-containing protein n=1 Tax=Sphaerochaeta sp. TaxID=1972642 RepID=UPI002A35A536
MLSTSLFAMLYITVCTVSLVTGILVLQNDRHSRINHAFFAIVVSLIVWTLGLTVSTVASTMAFAILGQQISSFGWANLYAVLIIFILRLTGHKERGNHYALFIPTVVMMVVYGLPLNIYAYKLEFSRFGWIFASLNTFWDYVFYAYFAGYTLTSIYLLLAWKTETEKRQKKQILISLLVAFLVGSASDVLLPSFGVELPQLAPIILVMPVVLIAQALRSRNPVVTGIDVAPRYTYIFVGVALYVLISVLQVRLTAASGMLTALSMNESTFRGIITQLQMFISIYLVMRQKKTGVIAALLINGANLVSSVLYLIRTNSPDSIPGII